MQSSGLQGWQWIGAGSQLGLACVVFPVPPWLVASALSSTHTSGDAVFTGKSSLTCPFIFQLTQVSS